MPDHESYRDRLLRRIRALFAADVKPSGEDLSRIVREERAREGGHAKAAKQAPDAVAASDAGDLVRLADLSYEQLRDRLGNALAEQVRGCALVATFPDHVIYMTGGMEAQADGSYDTSPIEFYSRDYTTSDTGFTFGQPTQVERVESFEPVAAGDADPDLLYTLSRVLLGDGSGGLTPWIQIHRIGSWAVPHGTAGPIALTRENGDEIIRNFEANVLRRRVPLDEGHRTRDGGRALAWIEAIRWGSEGQGLTDGPEPDGSGPILYAKPAYNGVGISVLDDDQYAYISPEYDRAYQDKETGTQHGWVLRAVAVTNDPYLRLRSVKGEPAPAPALLEDGITMHQEEPAMPDETKPTTTTPALTAEQTAALTEATSTIAALREQMARLTTERHAERVTGIVNDAIRDGCPPALANHVKRVLLSLGANGGTDPTVRLSDVETDAPVSLFDALTGLLDKAGRVPFVRLTDGMVEQRPRNASLSDDELEQASRQEAARWRAEAFGEALPEGVAPLSDALPARRRNGTT